MLGVEHNPQRTLMGSMVTAMAKKTIYKCVNPARGEREYYVIPIHTDYTKRRDYEVLTVAFEEGRWKVFWGQTADELLLEDENFYVLAGEIDLDTEILMSVLEATKEHD